MKSKEKNNPSSIVESFRGDVADAAKAKVNRLLSSKEFILEKNASEKKKKKWYNTVAGSSAIGGVIGAAEGGIESGIQKALKMKEVTPIGRNALIGASLGLSEGVAMDTIRKRFAKSDRAKLRKAKLEQAKQDK